MQTFLRIYRTIWSISLLLLCTSYATAAELETRNEVRSMPLTNSPGSECPTTGVRVEQVIPEADKEEIVISIPTQAVSETANLRLYKLDNTAFAFEEFKELRDDQYRDRRSFSVVVAKSETLRFKVGFSSHQGSSQ